MATPYKQPFAFWGVPKDLQKEVIDEADQVFEAVLDFAGERIDKRREMACWWAHVHAGIIRRTNARRIREGKRPRRMLIRTRWMERAEAMCDANCKEDARLRAVHAALDLKKKEIEEQYA